MAQIIVTNSWGWNWWWGGGWDGDMKKSVYDPTNVNWDAFDYDNFHNTPDLSWYQTTSNLVTNLTNPDDTHYPSAKAVSDAITSAGGWDMLKSVYDPNNIEANAFDYNNFINTPTIPTVNTKTFTLASTSDLTTAQAAYDWYLGGNTPQILYSNSIYILAWVSSSYVYFVSNNEMWGTMWNSRSTVSISTVTFQKDWNTIETISNTAKYAFNFIETDKNYSTPYTPQYNWSPATKKYVDDTAAWTVSDTAYANTWDADTTHAPSKNAVYDKISAMDTTISSKAADSDVVKLTWNQTIAWTKTFSTSPVVPSKTTTATSSGTAIATEAQVKTVADGVATINGMISSNASSSNKLMDKNYIDDSINSVTAYYITKNAQGDQWATYAELAAATVFYSGGVQRTPTKNDYTIVLADENHDDATTRYIYNSGWEYQYTVNETALTQAQLDALNSWITAGKVSTYDWYASTISGKQDALSTQTAYTSKWTSTKVPTITTNTLWQVTSISETSIAFPVTSVNSDTWAVTVNDVKIYNSALAVASEWTVGYFTTDKSLAIQDWNGWTDIMLEPSNAWSNWDVITKTASGYEWAAPTGWIAVDSNSPIQLTKIWAWTQAQYEALGSYDATTVYLTI